MKRLFFAIVLAALSAVAQKNDTFPPNQNLTVENIPPIPQSIVQKAYRYREFRAAGMQSWHPTKRELLITTRFGSTNQIHEVKSPGSMRRQITFLPDRVTGASYPPRGGAFFLFAHDTGGGEWFQISRYDNATGEITLLTDGKSRNEINAWSHDGKRIAYTSTLRTGKDTDIYVMDPLNPKSARMLLQLEGGGWEVSDWSHDGKQLLVLEFVSANETYIWLADVAAGTKKLLTPKTGTKIAYSNARFGADDKGYYYTTDKDFEFQRLAYTDFASGSTAFITSDIKWDVDQFDMSDDGSKIVFETNEAGISRLYLLPTATRKHQQLKIPVGIVGAVEWHPNGREFGFGLSSARSSSDVYSYDVMTNQLSRWTYSETAVKTDDFPEPQLVTWKSFDGMEITGFLYMPPARFTGKRPVIVNIHGGPESQARPLFIGANNYLLNELGVAIIFPNVRGSSGYGKSFLAADNGMNRDKTYKDIGTLLDWIKANPQLDGDRIMVTGGSYGGHMTLAIATNYNDKIRCSKAVVPPSNLVKFLENTEGYRRDLRRVEYGDERDPQMRAYLEQTAPLNHVKNVTKPMFLVQGKNDPRVPISEANQMFQALKQNGAAVWYLVGQNEGHGFQKKDNQDYEFYATLLFVQNNLLN
jgi:dipeptidyl aminopeptidase/acylaminoacyl peptidase